MIATYNCRSLKNDDKLCNLENKANTIKWHVIGLSQVSTREGLVTLELGNMLVCRENNTNWQRGVGYLTNKSFVPLIEIAKGILDMVAYRIIKISYRWYPRPGTKQ